MKKVVAEFDSGLDDTVFDDENRQEAWDDERDEDSSKLESIGTQLILFDTNLGSEWQ